MSKPIALRLPPALLTIVDLKAKTDRTDKATALRQILYEGAEDYVLGLLHCGRIGLSRAATLLDVHPWEIHRLAEEKGVELGATGIQNEKALQTARRAL